MELLIDKNRDYRRYRPSVMEAVQLQSKGLQHVLSSNVSAVGVQDNDLIIRFINGSLYAYKNQASRYESILNSNSKGKWVWANLRRKGIPYEKIGTLKFQDDFEISDEEIFSQVDKIGADLVLALQNMGFYIPQFAGLETLGIMPLR
jgi:hypothetical protein